MKTSKFILIGILIGLLLVICNKSYPQDTTYAGFKYSTNIVKTKNAIITTYIKEATTINSDKTLVMMTGYCRKITIIDSVFKCPICKKFTIPAFKINIRELIEFNIEYYDWQTVPCPICKVFILRRIMTIREK